MTRQSKSHKDIFMSIYACRFHALQVYSAARFQARTGRCSILNLRIVLCENRLRFFAKHDTLAR
ncbi:hypothetical protein IE4771_CH03171 [Rhizobium etli bv. mimosae str. IE4771]|uniref:Uncharacterized protein n=1 Tax=Rhizobium etli bv. mimosae str. IE4771 TaxID=1432050 RepID=A0A060I3G5_RHIET|nr:hypothetical protein IE4771_CH03171 [Rhizobium sp. IE4771]